MREERKINIANKITFARIFLIPFCILELKINTQVSRILSCAIFIIAALTDALDGYIARSRNMVTNLGKFLDPLVDKILICSVLISLAELGDIDSWLAIIILIREFLVTGLRTIMAEKNKIMSAEILGKIKTISQMIMCIILILNPILNTIFNNYFLLKYFFVTLSLSLTIISGFKYINKNKSLFSN
ncbi:MAG: CDP-diacylglycerol--glycerol-3-phosphate 3-phosphatidyltransferase [Clostridiales bacterium]|nr:CDP-diacylglycerol--glycerol-3-phosphate 3-phosphatidyltransferase [Clostridiales bacterium]